MEDIIFSAKQVQGKKALFGKGRFALQNVDFELPSGYIMGIIGENGAGKTTFFRYIMEEKKHYHGSFYLDGSDLSLRSGCFCGRRVQERMQGCWEASMIPLIWIGLRR